MAHKNRQTQTIQGEVNDYEKNRQLRVKENQEKLRQFGVKNIAKSLTSLVESKKIKKKIVKPTYNNMRDVDYIPDIGDDSEQDYNEVATSVETSKKQHRPRYIAPMSMNKVANLAKQHQVTAPKVSKGFQLESNATKENHSRATFTMGELVSHKKGAQRQREIFKQKVEQSNSIKSGSKRRMVLVDEEYDENEDTFEDLELDGLEDDQNEEDIMRSEDDVDQVDGYEDIDHIAYANTENEVQGLDGHDVSENEDDVLIREQLEEISTIKKRGPTVLHALHTRKFNEREAIICNEFGQPIGPTAKEKDVVGQFSRFLGTIAHNYDYAPLIYSSWHKVPHKDKMWEYVLEKYNVPEATRTWVLRTIGHAYKVHKCRFKKKHFYQFKDNKTRWKNRPKNIPDKEFSQLLSLWNNKNVAKRCLMAKERRMALKNMHTVGPKSFARIRDEMKNDDPNKILPSLTQMFERTRKRTEGRVYVDTYEDTAKKIEEMKNYKSPEDGSVLVDPFMVVMNKERAGYRRLYGRGVTNTLINKVDGGDSSYMIPSGLVESFKASIEDELGKKNDEDHEKKKAELEALRKEIERKQENMEAMMQKLMEQLPLQG